MFKAIAGTMNLPNWIRDDPVYYAYELRDRLLDGTFYDHLPYGFYEEVQQNGDPVKLKDKRPSAQFRLPRMVSRWCARKLFAGRHQPRIRHPDKKAARAVEKMALKCGLWQRMSEAVVRGSVGACAATFRIKKVPNGDPRVQITIWLAKYCEPFFDDTGQLVKLQVRYPTVFAAFLNMGHPARSDLKPNDSVWFIRDYTDKGEVTYEPVKEHLWNPMEGFKTDSITSFTVWKEITHDFGFVPGHWFVNLPANESNEAGGCTWEDAIPNSIELDYTLSQTGRGVRYNAAPQLVIVGDVVTTGDGDEGDADKIQRDPMKYIGLKAGYKDEEGNSYGEGKATLLEMSGNGTKASLELIEVLRNLALEQIQASRKDPEKMKGALSGRAMEYLDSDSDDLIMDLRSQYGEYGALPLIKKICAATKIIDSPDALSLQWPRLFQPTPDEIASLVTALMAATGLAASQKPPAAPKAATPGAPAPKPQKPEPPDEEMQLITVAEARAFLRLQMDLAMIDVDDAEEEDEIEDDDGPKPSGPTTPDPQPLHPDDMSNSEPSAENNRTAKAFADAM